MMYILPPIPCYEMYILKRQIRLKNGKRTSQKQDLLESTLTLYPHTVYYQSQFVVSEYNRLTRIHDCSLVWIVFQY